MLQIVSGLISADLSLPATPSTLTFRLSRGLDCTKNNKTINKSHFKFSCTEETASMFIFNYTPYSCLGLVAQLIGQ